jgi:hypothetical protein
MPDFGQCDAPDGEFSLVSAGWYHSCALTIDNQVLCWGCEDNDFNQCDVPE